MRSWRVDAKTKSKRCPWSFLCFVSALPSTHTEVVCFVEWWGEGGGVQGMVGIGTLRCFRGVALTPLSSVTVAVCFGVKM